MQVLVIGSGGREHALAWKLAQSSHVEQVFVAPGNAGTSLENKVSNVDIAATDVEALLQFAKQHNIELSVVGPESALALGVVDRFTAAGLACFGPSQAAAQLESSKAYCKDFMQKHKIPTASYATFSSAHDALPYLHKTGYPIVIKADGLASGKGVVIAENYSQAEEAVNDMLQSTRFGAQHQQIVIEEFLRGRELSYIVMVDGEHIVPLASSKDHKARDNGNTGPNTGGMGAYSPAALSTEQEQQVINTVIKPVVDAMRAQGTPYHGFLYAGLMIDQHGNAKVLEFNCRLGDPETQPLMLRLRSDLAELCLAGCRGELKNTTIEWDQRPALGVVMCSPGYPEKPQLGEPIQGWKDLPNGTEIKVFYAGTRREGDELLTSGGRVLCITALGDDLAQAQTRAYQLSKQLHWPGCFYRTDIGD